MVQPKPPGRAGEGFAAATVITSMSLLYKRALLPAMRKPVRGVRKGDTIAGVLAPVNLPAVDVLCRCRLRHWEGGQRGCLCFVS